MRVTLSFLGGAGTVTGSRFLLRHGGSTTLVDCGLFQGPKANRLRNWEAFPMDPGEIDRIILTHAHIDHTGFLPRLVKQGYRGEILASAATCDLLKLLLPDAGHLQEEEARWHNRRGSSKHRPALALFTEVDARAVLEQVRAMPYDDFRDLGGGVSVRLMRAGHILGSALVEFRLPADGPGGTLLFTGDLGRPGQPILKDPAPVTAAGVLVLESTYGNRRHGDEDPRDQLEAIVKRTARLGGMVLIPAFAVGRTQLLLYLLHELQEAGRIPELPVFIDSPMAISAVPMYCRHTEEHDLTMRALSSDGDCPIHLSSLRMMRSVDESKSLNNLLMPSIIISASGMATGGRILHHLRNRLGDTRNSVVFVGYQAQGTRGRLLQDGARSVRIFGQDVAVRAAVYTLSGLSAHADVDETLEWLGRFDYAPRKTWLVHGEPEALVALAGTIREKLRWEVEVARDGDEVAILG